jgi:hypothetical protein
MSADPAVIGRLAEELEVSKHAAINNRKRVESAHKALLSAEEDSCATMRRLDEDRHTLLYYAEHGEMPKPGTKYLDFYFPE